MENFKINTEEMHELRIMINGAEYALFPYTLKFMDATEKFVVISEELKKESAMATTEEGRGQVVIKACRLVKETINSILGKNAYQKIFNNMTVNLKQHDELMAFVFDKVIEFKKENDQHINKPAS